MNKLLKTINNVICIVVNIYLLDIVLRKNLKKISCTSNVMKLCPPFFSPDAKQKL